MADIYDNTKDVTIYDENHNPIDLAQDATSQAIVDTIGEESGSTVLSKLQNIWDKLVSLFNDGIAKVKIWDGTYNAEVSASGRLKVDIAPASAPPDTTPVSVTQYGAVAGTSDTFYTIPNGETLYIQLFSGGASPASGSSIEIWYDPNGTGVGMTVIDVIMSNGQSDQHNLNVSYIGNGTRRILLRRTGLGSANARTIFGRWEGYY